MGDDREGTPGDLAHELGRRIRVLRAARGWTQEALAEVAGLHRNYIGHVERGELNISVAQLARIARDLDVGVVERVRGIAT
jgi:transcriptional regulator with XRE-family HTH domain